MADFLMRGGSPLSVEEWTRLDEMVVGVSRMILVGRRFIQLAGPFGFGAQVVPLDKIQGEEACTHEGASCCCESGECDAVRVAERSYVPLQLIHKDFVLAWRDIEAAHQPGQSLELGPAAAAAARVAQAEDKMVLQEGLLKVDGTQTVALGDWSVSGTAVSDVAAASGALAAAGVVGQYALVLSPDLYALLLRPYKASGEPEIELIEEIAEAGIFQSPVLGPKQALLLARGAQYLDLAVGQDAVTAYVGPEGMDHRFRVLESLTLRVKQPGAICVLK